MKKALKHRIKWFVVMIMVWSSRRGKVFPPTLV